LLSHSSKWRCNQTRNRFCSNVLCRTNAQAEVIEQRLLDIARLNAREKLSKSEKKLSGIIYERGVDNKGFAIIRSRGDHALFGGLPQMI